MQFLFRGQILRGLLRDLFGNPQVTAIKILTCTKVRNSFLTTYFFLQAYDVLADPLLLLGNVNQVMSDALSLFTQSFFQFFVLQHRKPSFVVHTYATHATSLES